jgi:dephospho-CoA kinase
VVGGGKSQVAALLGRRGAAVIDADSVGHEVVDLPDIKQRLVDRFGPEVLRPDDVGIDRRVDRKVLGAIVFTDPAARRDLEAVVHPEMVRRFESAIAEETAKRRALAIVLDAAILFEAGWHKLCDLVVFVDATEAVRQERVARDRGWTPQMLRDRDSAQWPAAAKCRRADIRIRNDASLETLQRQVDRLIPMATNLDAIDPLVEGHRAPLIGPSYEPVSTAPGDAR